MSTESTDQASTTTSSQAGKGSRRPLTRTLIGTVVGDHAQKTRSVRVSYQVRHPKYGKYLTRTTKYHVHDGDEVSKQGDTVEIAGCRPMSKTKSWRLVRVIESAPEPVKTVMEQATAEAIGQAPETEGGEGGDGSPATES